MPQRTIAEARRQLEELAPGLNPTMYARLSSEINAASGKAKAISDRMLDQVANELQSRRDEVLADACALRDEFQALTGEGELGTLSAAEYAKKLQKLQNKQRSLAVQEGRLNDLVSRAERIDQDPEAYGDSMFERFPHTRPDFTF